MITPSLEAGGVSKDMVEGDFYGTYYWTNKGIAETENLEGDDSRVILDRVIPFVRDAVRQGNPFLAVVWFHAPHTPVLAGEEYLKKYPGLDSNYQHYFGCITAMDEQIGRLRKELADLQVDRNTMVWFTSDNGPAAAGGGPGEVKGGRQQGETGGFRGRKGNLYEGGIRVPGLLVWPEKIGQHRETDFPAVTSDYLPTILDFLDLSLEDQPLLDGISLRRVIESDTVQLRGKPIGFQSIYRKSYTTVWSDDRYKLVGRDSGTAHELYDLLADPFEANDIATEFPEIMAEMKNELAGWLSSFE